MSKEAMKQALEALEIERTVYLRTQLPVPEYLTKAITSLLQAIATEESSATQEPKREWVGLTDEERDEIYLAVELGACGETLIETKLKEKNHG